jgi:Domain of unknown function (DUF4268)
MQSAATLGRLERITDLRRIWPDEARDFTPWLARPENLSILSEHLGLGPEGLELEAVERFVGPYKADILCRDTTTGKWVLIENQLEKTDHSHLGQLLVYAAGLDCKTIVWISRAVTPEHKVAVEWLNSLASTDTAFHALEIELWRIGESPVAPSFNSVVRPSEAARQAETAKSGLEQGDLTPAKQELLDYWRSFEALLADRRGRVRAVAPLAQSWLVHSIGRAGVSLNSSLNRRQNWVRSEIYLTGPKADTNFRALAAQRSEIEAELGASLTWYDASASDRRIYAEKVFPSVVDRQSWVAQHLWLIDQLEALHRVFHDRVRTLP